MNESRRRFFAGARLTFQEHRGVGRRGALASARVHASTVDHPAVSQQPLGVSALTLVRPDGTARALPMAVAAAELLMRDRHADIVRDVLRRGHVHAVRVPGAWPGTPIA